MQLTASPRRGQRGVSLIEVLVSIFVVSMGILALAGLLSTSSRIGKSTELRATATLMANDLADRIRANHDGIDRSTGVSSYDWKPTSYQNVAPTAPGTLESGCTKATPCNPATIAAIDLYEWRQRLYQTLPGGYGYVVFTPGASGANGDRVDVWVAWTDLVTVKNRAAATNAEGQGAQECPDAFSSSSNVSAGVRCLYLGVNL